MNWNEFNAKFVALAGNYKGIRNVGRRIKELDPRKCGWKDRYIQIELDVETGEVDSQMYGDGIMPTRCYNPPYVQFNTFIPLTETEIKSEFCNVINVIDKTNNCNAIYTIGKDGRRYWLSGEGE